MARAFIDPVEKEDWKKGKAAGHLNSRHLSWIRRFATKDGSTAARWRPVKKHRIHAQKWIAMTDNMFRVGTGLPGLVHFKRTAVTDDRSWVPESARRWPHLHLAQDQGSDGVSAIQACLRKLDLHIIEWWDESHGIQNDMFDVMKKFGCFHSSAL